MRLTLDRPDQHNPLTARCIREVLGAVAAAGADPSSRAIVIRGAGRSFCSGYGVLPDDLELGEASGPATIEADVQAMLALSSGWSQLLDCPIPIIAQVHGNCLAGGTDLALHCDLVVVATDARIGYPPVRAMGVPPSNMWLYHVGPQWTKRLLLTGDTIDGTTAAAIGFAQAAVAPEALDTDVASLAARMALVGRDVLVANKRVVNAGLELMGRSLLQRFAGLNDAVAHQAPEARSFAERSRAVGLRQAISELNAPFS